MLRGGTFRIWRPGEKKAPKDQHSDDRKHQDTKEDHQKNEKDKENKGARDQNSGNKKRDKGRKQRRKKPYARWFGEGGTFSFSFHRKKNPLEFKAESPCITKESSKEIRSPEMTKINSDKRSKKDEIDLKGSVDSGLSSDSSNLEPNSPNGGRKWSFKPRILRAMSFKTESESDFLSNLDNRRIVASPTSDFDVASQKSLNTPPLRNEQSRAIRPKDFHNQRKTPYGRKGHSLGTFDENIGTPLSSNMNGIIKTESSTLNRKPKKLAFYEPLHPYQSGSVQRSQSGIITRSQSGVIPRSQFGPVERSQSGIIPPSQFVTIGRSQSGIIPRSQFGTVGRSQSGIIPRSQFGTVEPSQFGTIPCSGMLERSPSGTLKLSQSRASVHRSQNRVNQSGIVEHTRSGTLKSRSKVQRSQSIAVDRSRSPILKPAEFGSQQPLIIPLERLNQPLIIPLECSQSMAVQRSQSMRINCSNSEEVEGPDSRKQKRCLPTLKPAKYGSHLSLIKEPVMVGNVSSQWQHLCKAASMEVILNIPSVDAFTINVIFNSNIVDSLNPVEISNVISNTRNILFANWFITGPNFEESLVRRSPNFNVILHQVQTFLINASGISSSKFTNLFKDLQNRCVSQGFYPPWVCLEETKSLYIDFWCGLAAMGV